jgi:hypothetical protein
MLAASWQTANYFKGFSLYLPFDSECDQRKYLMSSTKTGDE